MARRQSRRMSHAPRLSIINMAGDQEQERKYRVKDCLCSHVKSIVTFIMILAMVFCIVMIVLVHKWRHEKEEAGCVDIVIIGAGVSGSYSAWRLRHHNLHIQVYETTDRIGGNLYSRKLDGNPPLLIELGADHYSPVFHPLLNRTIHALKLPPKPYPPQNRDQPIYYLRDRLLRQTELKEDPHNYYNLWNHEKGKAPQDLAQDYMLKVLANTSQWVHRPLTAITKDNQPLYQQGLWNIFGTVASREGLNFLSDTLPWRGFLSNENAASLGSMFWAPIKALMTLVEGMQSFPEALINEFLNESSSHEVHLNRRLACMKPLDMDMVSNLTFIHTVTTPDGKTEDIREHTHVCAREVILAVPFATLRHLDWKPMEENLVLQQNLASVIENPAIVAYFTYNRTWWRSSKPYDEIITDIPLRKVRYVGSHFDTNGSAEYVFMVVSADAQDMEYFKGLLDRTYYDGAAIFTCEKPTYFISQVHARLAEMYSVWDKSIPEPTSVFLQNWSGEPHGGWTVWKRGVHWAKIQERMLKPDEEEKVYIVGNTFQGGKDQFSIEGAMQSVEEMLSLRYKDL